MAWPESTLETSSLRWPHNLDPVLFLKPSADFFKLAAKSFHGEGDDRLRLSLHILRGKFAHLEAAVERATNLGADQDIDSVFTRQVFDTCCRIYHISNDSVF